MKTSLEVEGGDPLARLRRMLDAADIDPESIHRMSVTVEHNGTDDEATETDALVERAREAAETRPERAAGDGPEESREEGVEYGPVEPDEDPKPRGRSGGGGGGGYDGDLPSHLFEGEAVRPGTKKGDCLAALADDGGWLDCRAVSEATGMEVQAASQALSAAFRRTDYAKRRNKREPGKHGPRYEYAATESGRGAVREGRRIAEQYRAEKREAEEAEMGDGM